MKICSVCSFCLLFLFVSLGVCVKGQARLILNGAKVNITNGASLIIENPAGNAITRVDGHIISEGESNTIRWEIGESTGTYVLPWGYGASGYLPLSLTKTAGSGNGRFIFSTFHTDWQNSLYLPSTVTNANGGGIDLSAFIIDRYWQINAQGYTAKPTLTNLQLSYLEIEHTVPDNTIAENSLVIERWNDATDTWNALVSGSNINTTTNIATAAGVDAGDLDTWWTLSSGHSILAAQFLSFAAMREQDKTRLLWTTQEDLNADYFTVQRSMNGRDFISIGTVKAKGAAGKNEYLFYDEIVQTGKLFYRIREHEKNGSYTYSETRTVMMNTDQMLSVYPNPVSGKKIMLNTTSLLPGQYEVSLFDWHGKLVYQSSKMFNRTIVPLQLDAATATGTYLLKIVGEQSVFNKVILIN